MEKIQQPLTIFLIGVTGDLARKKILIACYKLFEKKLLPETFALVGNARRPINRTDFQEFVKAVVKPNDEDIWKEFAKCLHYVAGDATEKKTFVEMQAVHKQLEQENHCGNHIWYIATLPELYLEIITNLKELKMNSFACGWTKVMIEKPFGTDLNSAKALNHELAAVFNENQIYRIDHFLGKETVQNVLAFRFANGIFEELWNNKYIDHVQVTMAESLGVGGRERFYDATGATRDVIQNHLLQIVSVLMMEEPKSLSAPDIRRSRSGLLDSLRFVGTGPGINAAFGQFTAGTIDQEAVPGYLDNTQIPKNSVTETATALKLEVDNERWQGVPIYIRTGKRLPTDVIELSVQFKDRYNQMFRSIKYGPDPNVLSFRFQPSEAIILRLFVKKPGYGVNLDMVPMEFQYKNRYQMDLIEAYERLIYDASQNDPTLFPQADSIESSWRIIDQVLEYKANVAPEPYEAGTWGPTSFEALIQKDGRSWIEPTLPSSNQFSEDS
jgi:glucose-6-phosphate 1-dehydrogenase